MSRHVLGALALALACGCAHFSPRQPVAAGTALRFDAMTVAVPGEGWRVERAGFDGERWIELARRGPDGAVAVLRAEEVDVAGALPSREAFLDAAREGIERGRVFGLRPLLLPGEEPAVPAERLGPLAVRQRAVDLEGATVETIRFVPPGRGNRLCTVAWLEGGPSDAGARAGRARAAFEGVRPEREPGPPRREGLHATLAAGAGLATVRHAGVVQAVGRLGAGYTGWYFGTDRGAGVELDATFDPGREPGGERDALVSTLGLGAFAVAGRLRAGAALDFGLASVGRRGGGQIAGVALAPRVFATFDVARPGPAAVTLGLEARAGTPWLAQAAATLGVRLR